MSLAYIRRAYGVPAKRGGRVRYTGEGRDEFGTIIGASGAHLSVRLDGLRHGRPYHPTWQIEYLPEVARERSEHSSPRRVEGESSREDHDPDLPPGGGAG
jgi:hypothetical protein